jgi:hypothetical protein
MLSFHLHVQRSLDIILFPPPPPPLLQRFTIRIERPDDVVTRTGGSARVLREKLVCVNPVGFECQIIEEILVSVKALEASGRPSISKFLQVNGDLTRDFRFGRVVVTHVLQERDDVTHRCALLAFPLYVSRALVPSRDESVTCSAGLHVFPATELPRLSRMKREKP